MTTRKMSPQTCSACGEKGHNRRSKICTKGKAQKKADMHCGKCRKKGHIASDQQCPYYGMTYDEAHKKVDFEVMSSPTTEDLAKTVRAAIDREVERRVRAVLEELLGAIERSEAEAVAEEGSPSVTDNDKE